jgi:hypothetical protein
MVDGDVVMLCIGVLHRSDRHQWRRHRELPCHLRLLAACHLAHQIDPVASHGTCKRIP